MQEFETFVYLDMEKTGSSFITRLFNKFCAEKLVRRAHHDPMEADCDPNKFYFISMRDPLDSYLSLYSFGCQNRGMLSARLQNHDQGNFYDATADGFDAWIKFALKPRNAKMLGNRYEKIGRGALAELVGLQSWRYLRLAIADAENRLRDAKSREDVTRIHEEHKLPRFVVRHETFVEDLCALLKGPLRHAISDLDGALDYARFGEPTNASQRVDSEGEDFRVKRRTRRRVREREWFVADLFGY